MYITLLMICMLLIVHCENVMYVISNNDVINVVSHVKHIE